MKTTKRKGFNFYRSYFDVFNELPEDDRLDFVTALLNKQFLGVDPEDLEGISKFAYLSQKHSIDAQVKGYEDKTGLKLNKEEVVNPLPNPPTEPPYLEEKGKEEVKVKEKVKEEVKISYEKCIKHFPERLLPKTDKIKNDWIDTIEKLNRIDNIPFVWIEKIVEFARNDDFWKTNFMSIKKLRNKNKEGLMYVQVFYERLKAQTEVKKKSQLEHINFDSE